MNILYISSEYPPETGYGGIGTYTKHIAEGMARIGHRVSVIASSNNRKESVTTSNGITIYRLPPLPYPLPQYRFAYFFRKFARYYFAHLLLRISWALTVKMKVLSLLSKQPAFDVIEAPECGAEGLFVPKNSSKRLILRLHTPWEMIRKLDNIIEPPGDRLALPAIEKMAIRRASSVSSPSLAMASYISSKWGINNITVIPNPIPVDNFNRSARSAGWIYTGRVERRKGVHHLINAYSTLHREGAILPSLTIVGRLYEVDRTKKYGTYIRQMIKRSGAKNGIVWIEEATLNDISSYLSKSSVAFFPSLWENYPYSCLEAMSSGCAVVASDCGGFREIIVPFRSGLLIQPDSEASIRTAMVFCSSHPDKIAELGISAKQRVTEIASVDTICRKMESFYLSIPERST